MSIDEARCFHCGRMFEPWTNEYNCSDECHDAGQRTAQRLVDLIGLFELAASAGDELTEDQARLLMDAERAAHERTEQQQ